MTYIMRRIMDGMKHIMKHIMQIACIATYIC